ncbi:hypothetical protein BASA81_006405 [Batrachochytrium salamandrivorans]|nr:hypothetical protein BASA81_006405 [Batrachochytrium salamandrivorans]
MAFNCSLLGADPVLLELCAHTNLISQDAVDAADSAQAGTNHFFLIWGSSLVFMMHLGFAMLSAGAIRGKNNKNILLSIVMDLCCCALAWFFCGYAFAFGEDNGGFIGSSHFVGMDVEDMSFWLFQYCFAATSATIVSGAIAERARFETYLLTSTYMSIFVYPVVVHWVWGGGFLTLGKSTAVMSTGVIDFAGCGPVHMVGGVAGAVASKIMGPRIGRFDPVTGKAVPIPGHSSPLATLGTFILWVGWIGFNCGSALTLADGGGAVAARAGVMTILCSSAAALSSMFLSYLLSGRKEFDLTACLNGALGGLVSITGCCAFVEMWAAICIGLIGGVIYVGSSRFTLKLAQDRRPSGRHARALVLRHVGPCRWCFLCQPRAVGGSIQPRLRGCDLLRPGPRWDLYGGNTYMTKFGDGTSVMGGDLQGQLLATALTEIAAVFGWVVLCTLPFFALFQVLGVLRVDSQIEAMGIDASAHGGAAYPEDFHPSSDVEKTLKVGEQE